MFVNAYSKDDIMTGRKGRNGESGNIAIWVTTGLPLAKHHLNMSHAMSKCSVFFQKPPRAAPLTEQVP